MDPGNKKAYSQQQNNALEIDNETEKCTEGENSNICLVECLATTSQTKSKTNQQIKSVSLWIGKNVMSINVKKPNFRIQINVVYSVLTLTKTHVIIHRRNKLDTCSNTDLLITLSFIWIWNKNIDLKSKLYSSPNY